jgi:hypothetical protein
MLILDGNCLEPKNIIFSITTPVGLEIWCDVSCVCTCILQTTVLGRLRPSTVNITNESQGMDVSTHLLGTLKHVLVYGSSPLHYHTSVRYQ